MEIRQSARVIWNNANQLRRVSYRVGPYLRFTRDAIARGVNPFDLVRTQFPLLLPSASKPPMISLELTGSCNLRCDYCYTLLAARPQGIMTESTFKRVLYNVEKFGIERVRLIGGEPTMHPQFGDFAARLAKVTKYLQLVTNAQWKKSELAEAIVRAPIDLIEVSIDAGGRDQYEESRQRASYDLLLSNLKSLSDIKRETGSKSTLNIRLMVRPSNRHTIAQERELYLQWADVVMPQLVIEIKKLNNSDDTFSPLHIVEDKFPVCTLPFKAIEVKWSGDMPLCGPNDYDDKAKRIGLGNINEMTIVEAWRSAPMRQYRNAHRRRNSASMPACKGCQGI